MDGNHEEVYLLQLKKDFSIHTITGATESPFGISSKTYLSKIIIPPKNFFRRLKMHYQTFLRLRYWHVGACRIFASIQVFWRSGRKGCLIFKPLLVRTQDTTYWRILLIFFKKESNPSLANWLLMCTCNFLNSMLGY